MPLQEEIQSQCAVSPGMRECAERNWQRHCKKSENRCASTSECASSVKHRASAEDLERAASFRTDPIHTLRYMAHAERESRGRPVAALAAEEVDESHLSDIHYVRQAADPTLGPVVYPRA